MKTNIKITAFALCALFAACQGDRTRQFIPGTYVNHSEGELSIADDTLVIEPSESNHFYIYRKTGYRLIQDGKAGERKYQAENWNATYDEATKTLTETRRGKQLSFFPEEKQLLIGKRRYQKID